MLDKVGVVGCFTMTPAPPPPAGSTVPPPPTSWTEEEASPGKKKRLLARTSSASTMVMGSPKKEEGAPQAENPEPRQKWAKTLGRQLSREISGEPENSKKDRDAKGPEAESRPGPASAVQEVQDDRATQTPSAEAKFLNLAALIPVNTQQMNFEGLDARFAAITGMNSSNVQGARTLKDMIDAIANNINDPAKIPTKDDDEDEDDKCPEIKFLKGLYSNKCGYKEMGSKLAIQFNRDKKHGGGSQEYKACVDNEEREKMRKKWVNMKVQETREKRSRTKTWRRVSRKKGRYLNFTRTALSIEITTILLMRRIMVVQY